MEIVRRENYSIYPMTISQLVDRVMKGTLRLDLPIQRNLVWEHTREEAFISSCLRDFPGIPAMYICVLGGITYVLDGKQRLTALSKLYTDKLPVPMYATHPEHKIAGMKYSELPEEVKEQLGSTPVIVQFYGEITEEAAAEIFKTLNAGGIPLTKFEVTRSFMGSEISSYLSEMAKKPFFQNVFSPTKSMVMHFGIEETILQIIYLMTYRNKLGYVTTGVSGDELRAFSNTIRKTGVDPAIKEEFEDLVEYFTQAFGTDEKISYLVRTHMVVGFIIAAFARDNGIPAGRFADWIAVFINNPTEHYLNASKGGSAGRTMVGIRFREMYKDFESKVLKKGGFKWKEKTASSSGGQKASR